MTKPASTPVAGIKFLYHFEFDLFYRNEHHLCDSLAGLHFVAVAATIPAGDENLPLVIRIDEARKIAQHQPVFVTQPGSR